MPTAAALTDPPTGDEAAVLARIDAAAMLERTLAWSAINSGSRNLAGLAAMADALTTALAALGPVARVAPTPATTVDAAGATVALVHGDSLHVRVRPDAPVRVLLTGHMDTVFAADHPFQATRWRDAGTLNGPGTADMKGGIAVMLAALEAVLPAAPDLGVEIVINADEEVSSPGSAALLRAAAARCHLGLTYEPALADGTLAGARAGSGNFTAVVRGRAAHAGREPEKGRNAIVAASDLAMRLAALARAGLSVNPAKIDGGGPNNIVPDLAILRWNMRPASPADEAAAEAGIAAAVAAVAIERDVTIDLAGGFARPPKPLDANQAARLCPGPRLWRGTRPRPRVARYRRRVRRQQPRRDRPRRGRHDGRAGRRDPFSGRISARQQLCRTRAIVGARSPPCRRAQVSAGRVVTWHVRPARTSDLDALLGLAALTGGGFTNLPPDRAALARRLARSDAAFAADLTGPVDECYLLILEQAGTGRVGGTAAVFSRIGTPWPFYSYKISTVSQTSRELARTFSMRLLNLCTDHDGASEVGGLFLHPDLRTGGLGRLLARSRYLLIASHRARFADMLLAELRGWLDEDGNSPFWDGLGRRFFGMGFREADEFNSIHGNQFIADLMPKSPVYLALLSDAAQAVTGRPHDRGVPAQRLLEGEGFRYDNYVDIFDGGPTMTCPTDQVRTVATSRTARVTALADNHDDMTRAIVASGKLADFRCWLGHVGVTDGGIKLPAGEAALVGVTVGDEVVHVGL